MGSTSLGQPGVLCEKIEWTYCSASSCLAFLFRANNETSLGRRLCSAPTGALQNTCNALRQLCLPVVAALAMAPPRGGTRNNAAKLFPAFMTGLRLHTSDRLTRRGFVQFGNISCSNTFFLARSRFSCPGKRVPGPNTCGLGHLTLVDKHRGRTRGTHSPIIAHIIGPGCYLVNA